MTVHELLLKLQALPVESLDYPVMFPDCDPDDQEEIDSVILRGDTVILDFDVD